MRKILLIISFIVITILIGNCKNQPVNIVRIPVKSTNAINLIKYKNILYKSVKTFNFPSEYDPGPSIDYFFLNELPKIMKKPIRNQNRVTQKLTELKDGNLLLIGGDLTLKIKERNVIDVKKGRNKRRVFVKIENWEIKFNVFFRDMTSGKNIFKKTFRESLNGADKKKPDYNFEFLFRKITEKFVNFFMGLGRLETRYLMK